MKLLAIAAVLAAGVFAQTPELRASWESNPRPLLPKNGTDTAHGSAGDVAGIMETGRPQSGARVRSPQGLHVSSKQTSAMNRGRGKIAREEKREYDVAPGGITSPRIWSLRRALRVQGQNTSATTVGYKYKDMDIDGELIDDISKDLTDDRHSARRPVRRPVFR